MSDAALKDVPPETLERLQRLSGLAVGDRLTPEVLTDALNVALSAIELERARADAAEVQARRWKQLLDAGATPEVVAERDAAVARADALEAAIRDAPHERSDSGGRCAATWEKAPGDCDCWKSRVEAS